MMDPQTWPYRTPGIPDEMFNRLEEIPMTKEEIRTLTLSKARLKAGDKVIDIGSGSGSITVEAALLTIPNGIVYGIDQDERAAALTRENAKKFGVEQMIKPIQARAPEALKYIPLPVNAVIVGGGSESIDAIIEEARKKLLDNGRIVINAILVETMCKTINSLSTNGFRDIETTYVIIAKGRTTRVGTAMLSRNPVMIISAVK